MATILISASKSTINHNINMKNLYEIYSKKH